MSKPFEIPNNQTIREIISDLFQINLPITGGNGKSIKDAIVMNVDENYVQNEYVVLEYLGFSRFMEWKVLGQKLLCIGDKRFDCITISVYDVLDNTDVWTEEYFFDITDCLGINADRMVEME